MEIYLNKKMTWHKFVSIGVICALLINLSPFTREANALAPWISSQSPASKAIIRSYLERMQIIPAEEEQAKALLQEYQTDLLLLNNRRYLVSVSIW